jgi:ferredoxin
MTNQYRFELDSKTCLFCGACASIAPDHFFVDMRKEIAEITNQPKTEAELTACRAAMINCPGSAIHEVVTTESGEMREAPPA